MLSSSLPHVKQVPVSDLTPNGYNPNQMSDGQLETLKKTIRKDGFLGVVLANKTAQGLVIIDGEHRCRAARELGLTTVPCFIVELPENRAKAITIKLNQIHGSWNGAELVALLRELPDPIDDFGFNEYEYKRQLEELLTTDTEDGLADDIARQIRLTASRNNSSLARYVGFLLTEEQQALLDCALELAAKNADAGETTRSLSLEAILKEYVENHQKRKPQQVSVSEKP